MISCRKAAELTEKKLAGEIGRLESMQLMLHRAMCEACRRYGQQSQALDNLLRNESRQASNPGPADPPPPEERPSLEDRILDQLKDL